MLGSCIHGVNRANGRLPFSIAPGIISDLSMSTAKEIHVPKLLVHVATGSDNPSRAALAFLVAKTAANEGHQVTLFLAADGVLLLRDDVLGSLVGTGTGSLREHYDALVAKGARFLVSGMSAKARGMSEQDLSGKPAEFAMPDVLVRLTFENDRVLTY